jgi:hypothetical protein
MYLPDEIVQAQVLIAVKTYPLPSGKYEELVCTAGFLPDGKWIRIYPVAFRALPYGDQYAKYDWIHLDLIRNWKDFRPESYRPKFGIDSIRMGEHVDTKDAWNRRKAIALQEVFTSMQTLIEYAYGNNKKSLATLKPHEIVDFVVEEAEEREWKPQWRDKLLQYNLFDLSKEGEGKKRQVIPKLPYKYSYKFLTDGDKHPRKLMIEDWEIGALYWNCLRRCMGDEKAANQLVREKYLDEFCSKKELFLFLGTSLESHRRRFNNPFMIIGVFYPPKPKPQAPKMKAGSIIETSAVQQQSLFDL